MGYSEYVLDAHPLFNNLVGSLAPLLGGSLRQQSIGHEGELVGVVRAKKFARLYIRWFTTLLFNKLGI